MRKAKFVLILSAVFVTGVSASQPSKGAQEDTEKTGSRVKTTSSLVLDPLSVQGYTDNPNSVIVLGHESDEISGFKLERSFKDALSVNIDRETVERNSR
ncbi:MAG: hypothetical protein ACLFVQ_03930 [Chitinispirillaceae bacterium]